jgi:uncharacterized protein YdaL
MSSPRGRGVALFVLAAAAGGGQSAPSNRDRAPVAIYYDGPQDPVSEGYVGARQIESLLGHFGLRANVLPIASYRPGQLTSCRAGFFVGSISGTVLPAEFLADVSASRGPFCWVGRHIGSLVNTPQGKRQFGFTYVDYRDDLEFREVVYRGVTLPKGDPDLNIVSIADAASVQVLATAVNDEKVTHPYAVRRDRFWYIADSPFSYVTEGDRYLVFCDLLHDILEIQHPPQATALVRIEDVSTEIDPGDLRQAAEVLAARRIPFQIAVIPIFRNPNKGFEVYLSDRQSVVEAIHYMIARGGTPVLHGVTHQYRGASGDDYEFWDDIGNRPISRDSARLVLDRLHQGLAECFASGIFPIAFETPHYGASETDYQAMKQVFTLFNERTMATPDASSIQFFPYPVVDRYGRSVVPENLGYLPADNPDAKALIEAAQRMRVVRDAVASFYFHPFLDPALLAEVVGGLAEAGYRFVSLREFGGEVDSQGRFLVRTSPGRVRASPQDEFWRLRLFDRAGAVVSQTVASARQRGPVEIDIPAPPASGWAAVDCLREPPQQAGVAERPLAVVARWWRKQMQPARRWLGASADLAPSRQARILWVGQPSREAANNQESYRTVLGTFGYRVQTTPAGSAPLALRPDPHSVLVVPEAAGTQLGAAQKQEILTYLTAGGLLIADGRQDWLQAVGLRWLGRRVSVSKVVDVLFPEMNLRWRPEGKAERFTPPEAAQQLMVDPESKQTLALAGSHGAGRYLYLAVPLDPHSPDATSHYPYFPEYLAEGLRLRQTLHSPRLEVYFDPSYREGMNLDRLAYSWRQSGIRVIYAAAWQFYRDYTFDYARLIAACHRNGIAVYAWFALPALTEKMWQDHPEWRERTATGADGRIGWRYTMNLQNPACFQAAMQWMHGVLAAYSWDGVNLTELNFDADFLDYLRPDRFIPMSADVRAGFQRRAGFDPIQLFAPASPYYHKRNPEALARFLQYREDLVTGWHERLLEQLAPVSRSRGWEVIITMLDSLHSNYVRPALGVDSRRIVSLMHRFDFTLQVEDPAEHWVEPPDRYRRFAETYRRLVPDPRRLMFDINVMPDRSVTAVSLPSGLATGTELARTAVAAASVSGRVALYCESTVPSQDWKILAAALAYPASVDRAAGGWNLRAAIPVLLTSRPDHDYYVDGRLWPALSPEGLLVPQGAHRLSMERPWFQFRERAEVTTRLLHLSGELLDARSRRTGIELRYRSPSRTVLLLSQRPREMLVDGRRANLPTEPSGGGAWAVLAPRGEHQVVIETLTRAGILVGLWSWASASVIAAFGALTLALMAAIYLRLRMRRGGAP